MANPTFRFISPDDGRPIDFSDLELVFLSWVKLGCPGGPAEFERRFAAASRTGELIPRRLVTLGLVGDEGCDTPTMTAKGREVLKAWRAVDRRPEYEQQPVVAGTIVGMLATLEMNKPVGISMKEALLALLQHVDLDSYSRAMGIFEAVNVADVKKAKEDLIRVQTILAANEKAHAATMHDRNRLSDACGSLRTENNELLKENAVLRRKLETFERKTKK